MLELKGKPVADHVYQSILDQTKNWEAKSWRQPHLVVILVGKDPASQVYVKHKQAACQKLGFKSTLVELSESISESELKSKIENLNSDQDVDAILLQLPLPKHLDSSKITDLISSSKDADGLTTQSLGLLVAGKQIVSSCTPAGIIEILDYYKIDIAKKNVLVIGRSLIVGTPLFHLLNKKNATVTMAHSQTENIKDLIKQFDFIFVAVGKPNYFQAKDFKKNAVVIDVGIHRLEQGLVGDVSSEGVSDWLKAITPVPGGVGPMTIAMLMKNTLLLAEKNRIKGN